MYKIIADSSCDMRTIETVPLTIYNDDVSYTDDLNMNITEMLDTFAAYKGRSYTACPGTDAWLKAFADSTEIYVVTITSGLSGTYNSAETAKNVYLEEHPDAKVRVFDSLSTGPGMCLLIEKIQELKEKGLSFEEVCTEVDAYQKKTELFFALRSLHNLAQNGRVNKVLASAIGAFGICIVAKASETGTIEPIGKSRGEKQTIGQLLRSMEGAGCCGKKVRISHIENEPLAKAFGEALTARFPDVDLQIFPARGLDSYYAERGAILIGFETENS